MRLTSRDQTILVGLGHFRVLTLQQIQRYYFGGAARNNVHERLSQLREANLLRAFPFGDRGKLAWTLTSTAARQIGRPAHIFLRPPNRNTLPHDLVVAEVGLRLGELGLLHEWISAYELQIRAAKPQADETNVPDAVFRLKCGDKVVGPIALEVENSYKTKVRILKRLDDYKYRSKMTDLWFLWREDWMGRTLKELPRSHKRLMDKPPLRVWVGKNSYNEDLDLTLEGPSDEILDIAALAQSVPEKVQTPLQTSAVESKLTVDDAIGDESSQEIERLRARCTPNSDGLITRDHYLYTMTSDVVVTAGPLENGVHGNGEAGKGKISEGGDGKLRDLGMTRGIMGLESGVQG